MTVKILIVDPDIAFSVPIKRALEASGDYNVNVFASGGAALELVERDPHDVVVIDIRVDDYPLADWVTMLRHVRPELIVIATGTQIEPLTSIPGVDFTLSKPYIARQLGPMIRDALRAETKDEVQPTQAAEMPPTRAPGTVLRPDIPAMPDLPEATSADPTVMPDATFRRAIDEVHKTGEIPLIQEEPPIPEDATVRSLVSGQPESPEVVATPPTLPTQLPPDAPADMPETPEGEAHDSSAVAEIALEVAADDTIPLSEITGAVASRVEAMPPEARPPIAWTPVEGTDQPTLIGATSAIVVPPMLDEPGFVAKVFDERPADVFPIVPSIDEQAKSAEDTSQGLSHYDEEFAMTFAPLLPPDEQPEPAGAAESSTAVEAPMGEAPVELNPQADETPVEAVTAHVAESTDPVAAAALQLMQLTVESAAQASILSRDGTLIALAGLLPDSDVRGLLDEVRRAWQDSDPKTAVFRYVQLSGGADYLMYSVHTVGEMTLTMLFPGDVPLKTIRRHARELRDALERVPEGEEESEAAKTLPSRPTDLKPPAGLRDAEVAPEKEGAAFAEPEVAPDESAAEGGEAQPTDSVIQEAPVADVEEAPETPAVPEPPKPPEGPYAAYTFAWLPNEDALAPETVSMVHEWLQRVADTHFWKIDGAEIQPTYVAVQLSIPATESAAAAVEMLMRETAACAPSSAESAPLWSETYYIVNGGRTVTQQEIANFIDYRRESQRAS